MPKEKSKQSFNELLIFKFCILIFEKSKSKASLCEFNILIEKISPFDEIILRASSQLVFSILILMFLVLELKKFTQPVMKLL